MSASSIQSSADVLLEAAASLEQPSIPTKKKKKEKKDKKTKLKRESLGETTLKDVKVSNQFTSPTWSFKLLWHLEC